MGSVKMNCPPLARTRPTSANTWLPALVAVQDGVLRPHHVEALVRDGNVFETPVHHIDGQGALAAGIEGPIPGVLDVAQVETGHVAAVVMEQVPGRPAVA